MEQTLAARIRRPFRLILVALLTMMVVTSAIGAYLLGYAQPQAESLTIRGRLVRNSHQAALDEQTALRGYLASGDHSFLETARAAHAQLDDVNAKLDRHGGSEILRFRLAQEVWQQGWAEDAADVVASSLNAGELRTLLRDDQALFEVYAAAQASTIESFANQRDQLHRQQRAGTVVATAIGLGVLVASVALATRHRERLLRDVLGPLDDILDTVQRISNGDLDARPAVGGPAELQRLAVGLGEMGGVLAAQDRWAYDRTVELATTAGRLRTILELAREIAGSISVRYVAEAAAEAAVRVTGDAEVRVHLLDAVTSSSLTTLHDSRLAHGEPVTSAPIPLGSGAAGQAARDARTVITIEDDVRTTAFPLVVGGRVTGVLEVTRDATLPDDAVLDDLLETLAAHTGAALEAARLHGRAEELSKVDGLTQLANRRRLDEDLAAECARSARYSRPLGLVMVDLDHFKSLNDRFGHQHGDEVLERVARVLADEVRTTDTVYRYGGEELVILARESTVEDTAGMAERLRRAIAADPFANARTTVTASFGVAAVPWDAASPKGLLAAADRALYDAKRGGRNRVALAQEPVATTAPRPEDSALQSAR